MLFMGCTSSSDSKLLRFALFSAVYIVNFLYLL